MQVTIQLIVQNDIFANKKGVKTLDCLRKLFLCGYFLSDLLPPHPQIKSLLLF